MVKTLTVASFTAIVGLSGCTKPATPQQIAAARVQDNAEYSHITSGFVSFNGTDVPLTGNTLNQAIVLYDDIRNMVKGHSPVPDLEDAPTIVMCFGDSDGRIRHHVSVYPSESDVYLPDGNRYKLEDWQMNRLYGFFGRVKQSANVQEAD